MLLIGQRRTEGELCKEGTFRLTLFVNINKFQIGLCHDFLLENNHYHTLILWIIVNDKWNNKI